MAVKVAACQYPVAYLTDWAAYAARLDALVTEAQAAGARLLVFPEYASLELASLLSEAERDDLQATLHGLQQYLPEFMALHANLARRLGVYILAASFPVAVDHGYRNRAHLFAPDGTHDWQDKLIMTRFEREQWGVSAGSELKVFDTALGRLGVNICYDAEFPLLAHAQVAAGAELILVPSCTDGWAGYHRVRIACQARALEGQCYVVQAPLVGEAPWSAAIDINIGLAGVFATPDRGLPDSGVLALGVDGAAGWTYAECDLNAVRQVRHSGQVLNLRDWDGQTAFSAPAVTRVAL